MRRSNVGGRRCVNKNLKKKHCGHKMGISVHALSTFLAIGQKIKNRNYNSLKVK